MLILPGSCEKPKFFKTPGNTSCFTLMQSIHDGLECFRLKSPGPWAIRTQRIKNQSNSKCIFILIYTQMQKHNNITTISITASICFCIYYINSNMILITSAKQSHLSLTLSRIDHLQSSHDMTHDFFFCCSWILSAILQACLVASFRETTTLQ